MSPCVFGWFKDYKRIKMIEVGQITNDLFRSSSKAFKWKFLMLRNLCFSGWDLGYSQCGTKYAEEALESCSTAVITWPLRCWEQGPKAVSVGCVHQSTEEASSSLSVPCDALRWLGSCVASGQHCPVPASTSQHTASSPMGRSFLLALVGLHVVAHVWEQLSRTKRCCLKYK